VFKLEAEDGRWLSDVRCPHRIGGPGTGSRAAKTRSRLSKYGMRTRGTFSSSASRGTTRKPQTSSIATSPTGLGWCRAENSGQPARLSHLKAVAR